MCADRQSDLRPNAEALAATRAPNDVAAEIHDLQTALHQLRVYQIEMGIQAEALQATQKALRDTQQQYADLYQHAPVGYLTLDVHGVIVELNRTAAQLLDGEQQGLVGRSLALRLSESSRADFLQQLDLFLMQPDAVSLELMIPHADGSSVWVEAHCRPTEVVPPVACHMVMVDISARKAAEEIHRRREIELQSLLDSQTSYFIRTDLDGNLTYWNRKFEELYTWVFDAEGIHGCSALDTIEPYHHQKTREIVEQCVQQPGKVFQVELDKREQSGARRPTMWEFCCLTDAHGVPVAIQCIGFDISRRRQLETAYAASEQRYHQMFESHGLPKLILDPSTGAIIDANPAAASFYGYDVAVLKSLNIFDLNLSPPDQVVESMAKALAGSVKTCQYLHRGADGTPHNVEVFTGLVDFDGTQLLYAIVTDITEEVHAKMELQRANDLLEQRVSERTLELERAKNRIEAIFNHSSDGILLLHLRDGILEANDTFEALVGADVSAYRGKPLTTFCHTEDMEAVAGLMQCADAGGETRRIEVTVQRQDGTHFDAEISASPVTGEPESLVCTVRDITERKAARKLLAEERNLLRSVIDVVPDYIYVKDLQHRIRLHNLAHARSMGVESTSAMVGLDVQFDSRPTWLLEKFMADDRRVFETGEALVNLVEQTIGADGNEIWASTTKVPLRNVAGEIVGLVGITHDITEAKAAEEAIRASEERSRATLEAMAEGIVMQGADGAIQVCNPAAEEILGLTREQMMGRSSVDPRWRSVHEDGSPFPGEAHPAMVTLTTGVPQDNVIMGVHKPDGRLTWISINSRPLFLDPSGKPSAVVATFTDITAQTLVQDALQQNQERLRLATEAGRIGVWDLDRQTGNLLWDAHMLEMYGISAEEFSGFAGDWKNYVHPDDYGHVRAVRDGAVRGEVPYDMEFRIVRPGGDVRYIKSLATVVRDATGDAIRVIGVNLDVTEVKQAELALRNALAKEQELSELKSRFVSMASHEFRTPLAGILAMTESLSLYRDKMTPAQMEARFAKIRERVTFMSNIIEDLLVLARMQAGRADYRPGWINLDELCREVIEEEVTIGTGEAARVNYACALKTTKAFADARMLQQVLSNLLSNALKYSASSQPVDVLLGRDGDMFTIALRDQGIGIPASDLPYLFEPFHRAGNVGQVSGTGLGLSIAMRAMEQHQGDIDVVSEEGVGTTFTVRLPAKGPDVDV